MSRHTPEPWPQFIDCCEPATCHPDSDGVVILGFDDYSRAMLCVNACAGASDGELAMTTMTEVLARLSEAERQRDELLGVISRMIDTSKDLDGKVGTSIWTDGYKQCAIDTGSALSDLMGKYRIKGGAA